MEGRQKLESGKNHEKSIDGLYSQRRSPMGGGKDRRGWPVKRRKKTRAFSSLEQERRGEKGDVRPRKKASNTH